LFLQPKPFPLLWWITAAYSARLAGGHLAIALPFGILSELLCLKIQRDLTFSSQNSLKSVILENTTGYVDNGPPLLVKDKGTDSNEDTKYNI